MSLRAVVAGLLVAGVLGSVSMLLHGLPGERARSAPVFVRVRSSGPEQRGVAMPSYTVDGYQSPSAAQYLKQIVLDGATWIQIDPTWYQTRLDADTIAADGQTPSDQSVERVIAAAHQLGLKVLLKPLVDVAAAGSPYRGGINPVDRGAWFASYTAFIGHYAQLASRQRVEELAVGTELAGVSADRADWLGVVRAVRGRYAGVLLYAANFDEYPKVTFWDAVDLVGIDAYWPLSRTSTSDPGVLQQGWAPIVAQLAVFAARTRHRVLFAEAGYASQRGSVSAPWSWTISDVPDQAEQAAGYQALLQSLSRQPWWAGVFWWAWDVPATDPTTNPLGYSPHGKAAEAVLRRWWT